MKKLDPQKEYNFYFDKDVFSKMLQEIIRKHQDNIRQKIFEDIKFPVLLLNGKNPITNFSDIEHRGDHATQGMTFIGAGKLTECVRIFEVSMFFIEGKNRSTYLFNFIPNTYDINSIIHIKKKYH